MRTFVLILCVAYLAVLGCITAAEQLFQQGMAGRDITLIRKAQQLNPLSAEYHVGEFKVTQDLRALVRAIRLQPVKPAYHMYYGLALLKQSHRSRAGDQAAVREICRAAQLKPYSKTYQDVCREYRAVIPE